MPISNPRFHDTNSHIPAATPNHVIALDWGSGTKLRTAQTAQAPRIHHRHLGRAMRPLLAADMAALQSMAVAGPDSTTNPAVRAMNAL
jgi:hypothetical protein